MPSFFAPRYEQCCHKLLNCGNHSISLSFLPKQQNGGFCNEFPQFLNLPQHLSTCEPTNEFQPPLLLQPCSYPLDDLCSTCARPLLDLCSTSARLLLDFCPTLLDLARPCSTYPVGPVASKLQHIENKLQNLLNLIKNEQNTSNSIKNTA